MIASRTGQLLRAIRIKRNLSIERVQYQIEKTGLRLDRIESHPEIVPLDLLIEYLNAIDMTVEEYLYFWEVTSLEFGHHRSPEMVYDEEIVQIIDAVAKNDGDVVLSEVVEGLEYLRRKRRLKAWQKSDNDFG